jgi:hypothetical protein
MASGSSHHRGIARLTCAAVFLSVLPRAALAGDSVLWTYDAGEPVAGIEVLPSGALFFAGKNTGAVFEVLPTPPVGGTVVWSLDAGLHVPDRARLLPSGNTLATDTIVHRVVELDDAGTTVWSFGTGGNTCSADSLDSPGDVWRTPNGDTVIADQGHNRVIRIDDGGTILWQYGAADCSIGGGANQLFGPYGVELLDGGDVLVSEVFGCAVKRITPTPPTGGNIVWRYGDGTCSSGPNELANASRAHLLSNGNVLIADSDNDRIIEVAPTLPAGGTIVWQYGQTGVAGTADGLLNTPYDAVRLSDGTTVISDYQNARLLQVGQPTPSSDGGVDAGEPQVTPDAGPEPYPVQWRVSCSCDGLGGGQAGWLGGVWALICQGLRAKKRRT